MFRYGSKEAALKQLSRKVSTGACAAGDWLPGTSALLSGRWKENKGFSSLVCSSNCYVRMVGFLTEMGNTDRHTEAEERLMRNSRWSNTILTQESLEKPSCLDHPGVGDRKAEEKAAKLCFSVALGNAVCVGATGLLGVCLLCWGRSRDFTWRRFPRWVCW